MAGDIKAKALAVVAVQITGSAALNSAAAIACNTAKFDASTNLAFTAAAELITAFGVAPAAGSVVKLYMVPALDGTNYGLVDTTTPYIPPSYFVGNFVVPQNVATSQRMIITGLSLDPSIYTAYVWNQTGQQMSANWLVNIYPRDDQYT